MVEASLQASNLPSGQLVVEVTEAAIEPELETVAERFESLHDLGVRIAIDDFGTGRSSLSSLQVLSIDILKVDRSYLEDVDEKGPSGGGFPDDEMLRGVVSLGQAMGIEVYGEGIETSDTECGCNGPAATSGRATCSLGRCPPTRRPPCCVSSRRPSPRSPAGCWPSTAGRSRSRRTTRPVFGLS